MNIRHFLLGTTLSLLLGSMPQNSTAQQVNTDTITTQPFDMGKMWTFDNPPISYFNETYQLNLDNDWFVKAQLGALRFSTYCSASFVSPNGLIMTNHHCSREAGTLVQKKGEDFNANGFNALRQVDERKVPDLFVDQLIKIQDITDRVKAIEAQAEDNEEKLALREQALENIVSEYKDQADWKDLEIQAVTFYNGGRFSLYGFKRYEDIRLVVMPELDLGFFGGDPDNFTYPRYNLDFTFFRAYDDAGKPLRTPNYFKFNTDGVKENEPVFVIGNPGSTSRLATVEELEMDRDFKLPYLIEVLKNRSKLLADYNVTAKNDSITNEIFSFENGIKSFGGQLKGLKDPILMARKKAFQKKFKQDVASHPTLKNKVAIWDTISNEVALLRGNQNALMLFQPNPLFRGELFTLAQQLTDYAVIASRNPERASQLKELLKGFTPDIETIEIATLAAHLKEANKFLGPNDAYVEAIQKYGSTPEEAAKKLYQSTKLRDEAFVQSLLENTESITNTTDPLLHLANIAQPRYMEAIMQARESQARLEVFQAELGNLIYDVYGSTVPPDATMSLRINDGRIQSYSYNGTEAPIFTTFYGLYDRHKSHQGQFPWSLPRRWQTPTTSLLNTPLNFVSTNDIIGGNSGSPIVNSKLEVVGLAFDGNIESLPGYFIFAPDQGNRTVSVHVGGIVAALKHIYKANRILTELAQ